MNCAEVKYYLNDYTKGILLDEIRSEIHEHLCSCITCTKAFDNTVTQISKTDKKKKNIRFKKEVLERIQKERIKNSSKKNITPKNFPSASTISSEADYSKKSLLSKGNEIDNDKLFVIAGIVSAIALGIILALLVFDYSPTAFCSVEKISGFPILESRIITNQEIIKLGEKLITDSESRARLKIGTIGEIDVEPQSEIKIIETKSSDYRLVLSKGKIGVRTWAAPRLFSIKTPSAVIKDLGCMYYLSVDDKSSTLLQVKSGWVLMENNNCKSLLSARTSCYSLISKGLGTPFSNNASTLFRESIYKLDFENGGEKELTILLSESRQEDLISLFHLLKSLDQVSRGKIYDQISLIFKMPQRITREGIVNGDKDMLGRLWTELGLGSISVYQNL